MSDPKDKGYKADIPEDAIHEALKSVEKHTAPTEDGKAAASREDSGKAPMDLSEELTEEFADKSKSELLTLLLEERKKAQQTKERMLRVAADADNQRKRQLRDREETLKFGQEKLLSDLLPILDNLERSIQHVPETSQDPAVQSLREGVLMVFRMFLETLAKHHLKRFDSLGQPFDPVRHEALSQIESEKEAPGTILEELQRGYLLHDRLLRPALVGVACPRRTKSCNEEQASNFPPNGENDK